MIEPLQLRQREKPCDTSIAFRLGGIWRYVDRDLSKIHLSTLVKHSTILNKTSYCASMIVDDNALVRGIGFEPLKSSARLFLAISQSAGIDR